MRIALFLICLILVACGGDSGGSDTRSGPEAPYIPITTDSSYPYQEGDFLEYQVEIEDVSEAQSYFSTGNRLISYALSTQTNYSPVSMQGGELMLMEEYTEDDLTVTDGDGLVESREPLIDSRCALRDLKCSAARRFSQRMATPLRKESNTADGHFKPRPSGPPG